MTRSAAAVTFVAGGNILLVKVDEQLLLLVLLLAFRRRHKMRPIQLLSLVVLPLWPMAETPVLIHHLRRLRRLGEAYFAVAVGGLLPCCAHRRVYHTCCHQKRKRPRQTHLPTT